MLTLPLALAALTAGVAGGVHCVGMCGGISIMLNRAGTRPFKTIPIQIASETTQADIAIATRGTLLFQMLLQSGRISTYMLIGALFGGIGSAGLVLRPSLLTHQILFFVGNLALVVLGFRVLGVQLQFQWLSRYFATFQQAIMSRFPALKNGVRYPFLTGMAWGCLPCGLLYSVIPFSLLSGDWFAGAMLMLLFGLSALPHLLLSQGLFAIAEKRRVPMSIRYVGGVLLVAIGLLGFWYVDMHEMPSFLCIMPAA